MQPFFDTYNRPTWSRNNMRMNLFANLAKLPTYAKKALSTTCSTKVSTHPSNTLYATIGHRTHKKMLQTSSSRGNRYYPFWKDGGKIRRATDFPNIDQADLYTRKPWNSRDLQSNLNVKTTSIPMQKTWRHSPSPQALKINALKHAIIRTELCTELFVINAVR